MQPGMYQTQPGMPQMQPGMYQMWDPEMQETKAGKPSDSNVQMGQPLGQETLLGQPAMMGQPTQQIGAYNPMQPMPQMQNY